MLVQVSGNIGVVSTVQDSGEVQGPSGPSDRALISAADVGTDSHVVLFVPGALELACGLIRQGVGEVMIARVGDRHPGAKADVAIVPDVFSREHLEQVVPCARRMLMPPGTLVIRIPHDLAGELSLVTRRELVTNGFSALRSWSVDGDVVMRAEVPLCGRLTCA